MNWSFAKMSVSKAREKNCMGFHHLTHRSLASWDVLRERLSSLLSLSLALSPTFSLLSHRYVMSFPPSSPWGNASLTSFQTEASGAKQNNTTAETHESVSEQKKLRISRFAISKASKTCRVIVSLVIFRKMRDKWLFRLNRYISFWVTCIFIFGCSKSSSPHSCRRHRRHRHRRQRRRRHRRRHQILVIKSISVWLSLRNSFVQNW